MAAASQVMAAAVWATEGRLSRMVVLRPLMLASGRPWTVVRRRERAGVS
jgi:hypothetical protein